MSQKPAFGNTPERPAWRPDVPQKRSAAYPTADRPGNQAGFEAVRRCPRRLGGTQAQAEGQEMPRMVARFTINAVIALTALDRGRAAAHDYSDISIWESLPDDRKTPSDRSLNQGEVSVPLLRALPRKR